MSAVVIMLVILLVAMSNTQELSKYIYDQLQAGLNPDEIAQQLRTANWDEETIKAAFDSVQQSITPPAPPEQSAGMETDPKTVAAEHAAGAQQLSSAENQTTQSSGVVYEAAGQRRGRIKTAWLLFKTSIKILQTNRQLMRYQVMSLILGLAILIVFCAIVFLGGDTFYYTQTDFFGDEEVILTNAGLVVAFVYYVLAAFITFMYVAGLSAHTLDIFRGKSGEYSQYMKQAWSRAGTIFFYSIITAIVGMILRALEKRRFIGLIVSRILGALWALATMFTIPIIVETDLGAPKAIKESSRLFISRWGENIIGRLSFGFITFLVYLFIFMPIAVISAVALFNAGPAGVAIWLFLFVFGSLVFAIVQTAASNILNVALYYYAKYEQVPATFSPDLLNAVYRPKKSK